MEKNRTLNFLVIEDEEEVADVICLFLGGHYAASFTVAKNGEEAVEMLKKEGHQYQMIISDYNMPNGNGSFVYNYISSHLSSTPFMLVTSDSWSDHKEFHNKERVGYVSKPFIDDTLIKETDRLLRACHVELNLDHKYVGISLPTLANIRTISYPLFIKLSEDKYVKILNSDTMIDEKEVSKFRQKGITYLYVERANFPSFISEFKEKVTNQMLFKIGSLKPHESFELSAIVHEVVIGAVKSFGLSKETEELARKNIDMVRQISEKQTELNSIFQWAVYSEQEYAFAHSVLICYLAAEVARHLNFKSPFSSEILSLAAYFHDLSLENHQIKNEGRFVKALFMQSKINKEDLVAVKDHPISASEALKGWLVCPQELYAVVREHHERPDGKGFPEGKIAEQIGELSACFIVCEDLVQNYLELKDRHLIKQYFESQREIYSREPFKRVHEYLMNKLEQVPEILAS